MHFFSKRMAAKFMRQILSAITYCHEKNIMHRDIKPENIIFVENDNLKLIDFGSAQFFVPGEKINKFTGTTFYIAPEVINEQYNEKCDVWSCGVILYMLLCGYPPFIANSYKETIQLVKSQDLNFENRDWRFVTQNAKNLIIKMLTKDPQKRISAREALNDEWFLKFNQDQPNQCQYEQTLRNIQYFTAGTTFKKVLLIYIAKNIITQSEINQILQFFRSIDHDNDGTISKDELLSDFTLLLKDSLTATSIVDRVFNAIDMNQSGKLDFTEFLLAASDQNSLLSQEKIQKAFNLFDADGDGKISKEELKQMLIVLEKEPIDEILNELGNRSITKSQFEQLLISETLIL